MHTHTPCHTAGQRPAEKGAAQLVQTLIVSIVTTSVTPNQTRQTSESVPIAMANYAVPRRVASIWSHVTLITSSPISVNLLHMRHAVMGSSPARRTL